MTIQIGLTMTRLKTKLRLWFTFAAFVGKVNTIILLTLLYLLVITPIGFLMRLLGKNTLAFPDLPSFWCRRRCEVDLERQF